MAPEILKRDYGREVDVWAIGMSMVGFSYFEFSKVSPS